MKLRFFAFVALALAACNAILGNEDAITYVEGDAASPGGDGSTEGAGQEGGSTDGGGGGDADAAAPDGDAAFDAASTDIPCDASIFCSDFDPPFADTPYGWDTEYPIDSGAIDTVNSVTPPNSLRFDFPTATSYRSVNKTLDAGRPFSVYFDVFVRTRGSGAVDLLEVVCKQASTTTVRVKLDSTGTPWLEMGMQQVQGTLVPTGQWQRIVLTIGNTKVSMLVVGPADVSVVLNQSCLGPFVVGLGPEAYEADGGFQPWTLLFDKVRVTAP